MTSASLPGWDYIPSVGGKAIPGRHRRLEACPRESKEFILTTFCHVLDNREVEVVLIGGKSVSVSLA
jgi:hypothetical protein